MEDVKGEGNSVGYKFHKAEYGKCLDKGYRNPGESAQDISNSRRYWIQMKEMTLEIFISDNQNLGIRWV